MVRSARSLAFLALLVVAPRLASAQSQITGTVNDASGAALPGVTVEASSAALIERTRAVVTDAAGQYRLVDLRPGVYTITFTITGFSTFKREGVELPDNFIATINAEMKLGALDLLEKPADINTLTEKIKSAQAKKMLILEKKNEEMVRKIMATRGW